MWGQTLEAPCSYFTRWREVDSVPVCPCVYCTDSSTRSSPAQPTPRLSPSISALGAASGYLVLAEIM